MNLLDKRNNLVIRDYLRIFYKRKWWGVVPFILAIGVGIFMATSKKDVYKSTTLLRISENSEFSIGLKKLMPTARGKTTDVKQLAKEIMSAKYIEKLIKRLDVKPDDNLMKQAKELHAAFPDKEMDEIIEELQVDRLKKKVYAKGLGMNMIEISVTAQDPAKAYSAAKTLVDIFIEDEMETQLESLKNALKFSEDQIAYYKTRVENAQKKLEDFNKMLSVQKVEDEGLDDAALDRIEETVATVNIRIDELERELQDIYSEFGENQNRKSPPDTPSMNIIKQHIYDKVNEWALLMGQFSWKDPQVIKTNKEIDDLREMWQNEVSKSYYVILNSEELSNIEVYVARSMTLFDIEIWNYRKSALQTMIDEQKKYVSQGPVQQQDLEKLQEEVDQMKSIYNTLMEQSQGTQLKEAMQRTDIGNKYQILEPARKPVLPISSGSRMMLALTGMLAVFAGFGAIFLIEFLDGSVRTVEEAEKEFDIPVIGVVPNLEDKKQKNHQPKVRVLE